eukprot:scaffold108475_cov39-Attheya_sp.AAC.1
MRDLHGSMSLHRARQLLDLSEGPAVTKEKIQYAFVRAAQQYHPDSRHNDQATPCAKMFQDCHEARKLLLAHYCGNTKNDASRIRPQYYHKPNRQPPPFSTGFPFRSLRILTAKQNIALRGIVMVVLTVGTFYDDWRRNKTRLTNNNKNKPKFV